MEAQPDLFQDMIPVPRAARFPVELQPPPGFRPDDPSTWPRVPGRLEFVGGRLLYMTPCGDVQQDVVGSIAGLLDRWVDAHPGFTFGTNEAGMLLGGEVRAADAAVWSRSALGPYDGTFRRVAPILAVEVAGASEDEDVLRAKAQWYLDHGVEVVWLVLPASRTVLVITPQGEFRHRPGERLPGHASLPDLEPEVARFFKRL